MDTQETKNKLKRLRSLHGKRSKLLEKNQHFKKAMEILKDVTAIGSAASTAYRYGPRAVQAANELIDNVLSYGSNIVEALNYLNDPQNYLISVTEDDTLPIIGEEDTLFNLELESGVNEVTLPEDISLFGQSAGQNTMESFYNPMSTFEGGGALNTIEGTVGQSVVNGYENGGFLSAVGEGITEGIGEIAEVGESIIEAVEAGEGALAFLGFFV